MARQEVEVFFKVEGIDGYISDLKQLEDVLGQVDNATKQASTATSQFAESADDIDALEAKLARLEGSVKLLAGSAEFAAGALGVLGLENNEFFEAVEGNVLNIIALAQGAIDISEGYSLLKKNLDLAKISQQAFNAVSKANPYLLLAGALIAAAGAVAAFTLGTKDNTDAIEDNEDAINEQNEALKTQIEREERLAELRGEDVFEIRLKRQRTLVEQLTTRQNELNAALEGPETFIEVPADPMDPTAGTIRLYSGDRDQLELLETETKLREATAALELLEEEATARREGRDREERARQAEADAAEAIRIRDAKIALEDELYALTLSARDQEELVAMQLFDQRVALAGDDEGLIKAAEEQLLADLAAIQKTYDDAEREKNQEKLEELKAFKEAELEAYENFENAKANVVASGFAVLNALAGDNQKLADIIFGIEKALEIGNIITKAKADIAQTISETTKTGGVLAIRAFAGDVTAGPALAAVKATGAATIGAIKLNAAAGVAGIAAQAITRFKGGGGGVGNTPAIPSPPSISAGGFSGGDLQAAGGGVGGFGGPQDPNITSIGQGGAPIVRAYVVATEVTDAQEANKNIEDLATL